MAITHRVRFALTAAVLALLACRDDAAGPSAPLGGGVHRAAATANVVTSPALSSSVDPSTQFTHAFLPMGNPKAMNEAGVVVGNLAGSASIAAVWTDADGTVLYPCVVGSSCFASLWGINNSGVAVGYFNGSISSLTRWTQTSGSNGTYVGFSTGQGSNFLPRINDRGDVSFTNPGRPMFIPSGAAPVVLSMSGYLINSGYANDLNDAGVTVGKAFASGVYYAVRWPSFSSNPVALPTLGGTNAEAMAINEAGDIVGWAEVAGSSAPRAVLWPATGGIVDLSTWAGGCTGRSQAWAINNDGVIAGECDRASVIWTAAQGMRALMRGDGSPALGAVRAINNSLTIVAESPSGGTQGHIWKRVADQTPPIVTATVTGTMGTNDWYTSNVDVSWTFSDAESGIASSSGCGATNLSTNSFGTTYTCSATNGTGLTSTNSVTVKRDATVPNVGPVLIGTLGNDGWYVSDVIIAWEVFAPGPSGASTNGCGSSLRSTDTPGATYECSATTGAGITTSANTSVKRDATVPAIAFSSTGATYGVDEVVSITCTVTDAMSGLATSSCPSASGPAYQFGVGAHTLNASASDNAGNSTTATASFTVTATSSSICTLVKRWVTNAGVANSLCVKLNQATATAFLNEIDAQSGKHVPAEKAGILRALAGAFFGS